MLSINNDQCEACAYLGACNDPDMQIKGKGMLCNDFKLDETNPKYWDCDCTEHYIHIKLEESCPVCGAKRDEMPDSRQREIEERVYFAPLDKEICRQCSNRGLETMDMMAVCNCCEGYAYFSAVSS
jgi:hypothetical protein